MLINLKDALDILNKNEVPIKYHTLYAWAINGVTIGGKPLNFATQIGSRWMVDEGAMNEIIDGVKNHVRVRVQKKKTSPSEKSKPVATKRTKSGKSGKKSAK